MRPSAILKWLESFPRFRWWCLLRRSRRLGAHPMTPSMWRFWVSMSSNSRSWRSDACGLDGLPRGFATYSLGHHPILLDWPMVWMRPSDSLGRSWLHGGRWMLSWRLCGLRLHEFGTCWTVPMCHLLRQHLCPRRWSCLMAGSMLRPLMRSVGSPVLRWLPLCCISQS
jgi:hypothetical protein